MNVVKLSTAQREALVAAAATEKGQVFGRDVTIAALFRLGLVDFPYYAYGSGRKGWAWITEAGREAVKEASQP